MKKKKEVTRDQHNAQRAALLRDRVARFDKGFRRQYPLLVDYVNGTRPIEDCKTGYYRNKIRAHLSLMEQLQGEADRLLAASHHSPPPPEVRKDFPS